jgi:peroxiredoxin
MSEKKEIKNYFKRGEADLIVSIADDGRFANAIIRQTDEDHDVQLKLDMIAEFSKEMLGIRVTRSSDILGRRSITMAFKVSAIPHMPFTEEEDLKKFWLAHIQKTQIDEMCRLRPMTTKSEKVIAFCRRFSEEQK